ncbi:DUF4426 domain-containing protein [Coralloluteibacterium thermophilus]|uniref:DUF4426 domain-containing protein n=1 Tax=Coralloluteibacterium thermophilum TaxID=2707049 RepID=A0ABV9NLS4_9GAMM
MRRLVALALLSAAPAVAAQNLQQSGTYLLHYNAMPSTQLPREVARRYAIVQSPSNVVLTVSLQKRERPGYPTPVPAEVRVTATGDTGRSQTLQMRAIDEAGAVSYLGQARLGEGRQPSLTFDIEARPHAPDAEPIRTRYVQQFFAPVR